MAFVIVAFFISMILIPLEILNLSLVFETVIAFASEGIFNKYYFFHIVSILRGFIVIILCLLLIFNIIRKTNFINYTRLSYEEFKEKRQEKKAEKQKKKAEKLEKQLNALKKDTE